MNWTILIARYYIPLIALLATVRTAGKVVVRYHLEGFHSVRQI